MNEKQKNDIMFRVRTIKATRNAFDPRLLKVIFLSLCFVALASSVSFQNVLTNMFVAFKPSEYVRYVGSAFIHTRPGVQTAFVLFILLFVAVVYDLLKASKYILRTN